MSFSEGRGYRGKPKDELRKQLDVSEVILGNEPENSLTPPTMEKEDVINMPLEELKKKYARRYEIYSKLLREQKYAEQTAETTLSEQDVQDMKKWLRALNNLDRYIETHIQGEQKTLREQQLTVFEDLRSFLEAGGKEGYIKLPTGVGKSVLFTEFIEALDLKTMIVVPTTLLIAQTEDQIDQFAPDLDVGAIYSEAKEYGRQVTITTYDSFVNQVKAGKLNPSEYDCLILDEVHQSLSEERTKAVQKFDHPIKIGFTATPEFSERKKVSDLLETEIHRMDIREAVEDSLLASFSAIVAKTEVDLSNVQINKDGEYVEEELAKAVNLAGRNQAAVELYKENFNGQLAVTYCVGVRHAEAVAEKFNKEGISAAHISGEMHPRVQMAILKKFKEGEIKVLCNADLLITGFDEPQASVCFNLRPTKSRVVAEQRGGRVLRLDPKNEQKHAVIIDFLDEGMAPQKQPILFASIVEGSHFFNSKTRATGQTGTGGGHQELPIIDVPGLKVVTQVEEVMKIVHDIDAAKKKENKEEKHYETWEEAAKAVSRLGIKQRTQYWRDYKLDELLPKHPDRVYRDVWLQNGDWSGFLERERWSHYATYEEAQKATIALGITKAHEYSARRGEDPKLPALPDRSYADVWKQNGRWRGFLRGEKRHYMEMRDKGDFYATWDEASEATQRLGIQKSEEYYLRYKEDARLPSNPHQIYKDVWKKNGRWDGFLGKDVVSRKPRELKAESRNYPTYEEAQAAIVKHGVSTWGEYYKLRLTDPRLPALPGRNYASVWKARGGWPGFLRNEPEKALNKHEREEMYETWEEASQAAQKLGIQSGPQYYARYKEDPKLPGNPHQLFKDVWNKNGAWYGFLGKKKV